MRDYPAEDLILGKYDSAAFDKVIVATGASVVDGTLSSLNGNDRWLDGLSRRVHEAYGRNVSVVNTGLSGIPRHCRPRERSV